MSSEGRYKYNFLRAGIYEAYIDKTLEDYREHVPKECIEVLERYLSKIKVFVSKGAGVGIIGKISGSGKTGLLMEILKAAVRQDISVQYASVPAIMRAHKNWTIWNEIYEILREVNLIAIDDIGREKNYEESQDVLYSIVNYRLFRKKPTLFASEKGIPELVKLYPLPLVSALRGSVVLTKIEPGIDYRKIQAEQIRRDFNGRIPEA